MTNDCWALSLSGILQFVLNKDRPTNQHHDLDIEKFIRDVKFSSEELKAYKKLNQIDLAVGSLKRAMDHMFSPGLGKIDGRKGPKATTFRSQFLNKDDASPDFIVDLLETKGLVGITVAADIGFKDHKDGILVLRKLPRNLTTLRHALLIVGYGRTRDGKLFFVLQNSWGPNWGVKGYGRVTIEGGCDIFYLNKLL